MELKNKETLEAVSKPHLRPNGCVAPLARDSHLILYIRVQHRPPINILLIPPLAGLRFLDRPALDAYLNFLRSDM
jgi:hypothetical protein